MKKILLIFFAATVLILSCKKDETGPAQVPGDFSIADPKIVLAKDAYGILDNAIINFEIEIPGMSDSVSTAILGKARAVFFADPMDSVYSDAGCDLSIGIFPLIQQADKSYIYEQGSTDSSIYRNHLSWYAACRSIDKKVVPGDFPSRPVITSSKSIERLSGYTAKNNAISGADSVIYQIQTTTNLGTKVIQKTMAGNSTQCNFTYDDLILLNASNAAVVTICGYRVTPGEFGSQKYYFIYRQSTSNLVLVY